MPLNFHLSDFVENGVWVTFDGIGLTLIFKETSIPNVTEMGRFSTMLIPSAIIFLTQTI